jgi:hypothetical protein
MDRKSRRRIWKVEKVLSKTEKLVAAALVKREQTQEIFVRAFNHMRPLVRPHTTAVAAIVIWGEPKIDEPLICAWRRTLAYHGLDREEATKELEVCPDDDVDDRRRTKEKVLGTKLYPIVVNDVDYQRPYHWWNPDIVHAPESARFMEVFKDAPVWLLQFTKLSVDAELFEFVLPDLSEELSWGQEGLKEAQRWPLLPLGTIGAGDPVCAAADDGLSENERRFYEEMQNRPKDEWSRFERRRMEQLVQRLSPNAHG